MKSLGGAYVKVSTNDGETFEFMDDSPLKIFEEIRQKAEISLVTLLVFSSDAVFSCFFNSYYSGEMNSIDFCALSVTIENYLRVVTISIDSDNKITFFESDYTLTPAT